MKKFIVAVLLTFSAGAYAQHGHHHHHGHWRHGHSGGLEWVVPAIIGGVIVYQATRPPVIVQPPVVYPNNLPTVQSQTCTPWTEIQNIDGSITRTRTCN